MRGLVLALSIVTGFWISPLAIASDDEKTEPDQPSPLIESPFLPPVRLQAGANVIDSGASWGHSGPWVADVDGDGRRDLVVGDFSGLFRFYRNIGSAAEPLYAEAKNLQAGGQDALVPIY